jgi:fatty acid desaturase
LQLPCETDYVRIVLDSRADWRIRCRFCLREGVLLTTEQAQLALSPTVQHEARYLLLGTDGRPMFIAAFILFAAVSIGYVAVRERVFVWLPALVMLIGLVCLGITMAHCLSHRLSCPAHAVLAVLSRQR